MFWRETGSSSVSAPLNQTQQHRGCSFGYHTGPRLARRVSGVPDQQLGRFSCHS